MTKMKKTKRSYGLNMFSGASQLRFKQKNKGDKLDKKYCPGLEFKSNVH